MVKSYVINLERHKDRLEKFYKQNQTHFFERVNAIDKNVLTALGYEKFYFNTSALENKIHRKITIGEIACTLSHILCWNKIASDDELLEKEYALIAEDDIILSENFCAIIKNLIDKINDLGIDYKLIILHKLDLYHFSHKIKEDGQYHLIKASTSEDIDNDGSALYLLRKDKAIELVEFLNEKKPFWLADHFSTFCPDKVGILFPFIGYINETIPSDLEIERTIARQNAGIA